MGRHIDVDDLVDAAEIGARLGVEPDTVHAWRRRHADFPAPVKPSLSFYVWAWPDIQSWYRRRQPRLRSE